MKAVGAEREAVSPPVEELGCGFKVVVVSSSSKGIDVPLGLAADVGVGHGGGNFERLGEGCETYTIDKQESR
jgi:hypothetical protein